MPYYEVNLMEQILFVNACVRPQSRTLKLARFLLSRLPGQMTEVDLNTAPVPFLDREGLSQRDALLAAKDFSAPMLRHGVQFSNADTVVIAAPYWDLMFPALLKAYLEAVTVSGLTFHYTEDGRPATLCRARRLIYVTTAGGPIGSLDFGFQYVSALARGFFEIPEVHCVKAEGLDIVGADVEAILRRAEQEIAQKFH